MTERGDQLNDCRLRSLRASGYLGPYPDMWREHLQSMVGTEIRSITDLEYAWLGSEGFTGHLENRWFDYLRSLNYTGALNDMLLQFWCDDGGGPVFGFKALRAWVWIDDRFVLIVKLSDDWAAGNVNTGVTIVSDVNGSSTVNGIHIGDEIEYEMDWEAAEGEVITITFSGSEIENGDGDLLEDTVLVALNESDDTPPQLVSATIPADGNFVNVVFDEEVHSVGSIYHVGWSLDVTAGGTPRTIGTDSSSGSGATWSFHLDDQVKLDETLNIDYDSGPGNIWDLQFNYMASLTNDPVTNNSTQSEVPTDPPELTGQVVENATPSQVDLTFSEPVLGTVDGWDVTIGGVSVTGLTLVGASDTRQLTFTEVITIEDVVRVIYVESSGNMEDTAGLPLPDYDELVTNNVNPVWESDIPDFLWPIDVSITPYDVSQHTNGTSHTYTLVANSWPTGISMSSAGVVSGTPTIEQTNNGLVVRATAGAGFTDSAPFNAVASAVPALTGYVVELATPNQVDLTFSEAVLGTVDGWDVTIDTVSVTGLDLVGATDTRQLTFNETVYDTHAVRVIYVEASGNMQDTAALPLPDYDVLATNNAGPAPSVVYELDATFHRYGASGPQDVLHNDVLAGSDSIDFPADAEIDKGTLLYTINGVDTVPHAVLNNQKLLLEYVSGSIQRKVSSKYAHTKAAGLSIRTLFAIGDAYCYPCGIGFDNNSQATQPGDAHAMMFPASGVLVAASNGSSWSEQPELSPGLTPGIDYEFIIVCGGFDATGQPAISDNGFLYFRDGVLIYSSSQARLGQDMFASCVVGGAASRDVNLNEMQVYTDTTPLATPARSLFASDNADIADYTPEDGVVWTTDTPAGPPASTSGGVFLAGSNGSTSRAGIDNPGGMYLEFLREAGTQLTRLYCRVEPPTPQLWKSFSLFASGALFQLRESETVRAEGTAPAIETRYILTDDGQVLTAIDATLGEVLSYSSTVSNTLTALLLENSGAGSGVTGVKWFCARTGTVEVWT